MEQQHSCSKKGESEGENLGNPDPGVADHQAVSPQSFDPAAPDSVPQKVQPQALPVILPLPAADNARKEEKACKIPEALIQKSRMHGDDPTVRQAKPHSAENVRFSSKGFPVEEVSPSPDRLTEHTGWGEQIQHRKGRDLFASADEEHSRCACKNAAVDGQPALPYGKDFTGVLPIIIQPEKDIIEPCTDNGSRQNPEEDIVKIFLPEAEVFCPVYAPHHPGEKSKSNDYSVEINRSAEYGKSGRRVERQIAEQGKGDDAVPRNGFR